VPFVWSCSHHQLVSAFETSSRILSIENSSVYETDICNLPLNADGIGNPIPKTIKIFTFSPDSILDRTSSTGTHFSKPVNGIHRHLRPTSYRDAACDPLSASQVCTCLFRQMSPTPRIVISPQLLLMLLLSHQLPLSSVRAISASAHAAPRRPNPRGAHSVVRANSLSHPRRTLASHTRSSLPSRL